LLGPNGSGKSTLIKAILGLVSIQRGTGDVLGLRWPEQCRAIRDLTGYLPEDDCYVTGLQGIEAVQLAGRLSGLPSQEAKRRAHEVLDICDVGQERYRNVETYSTGMRQKLKFAQALVHDPAIVILDEPTTGLDPTQRFEFLNRIAGLAKHHGKCVLLSTHILHDVRQICDHVVILAKGRVQIAAPLAQLSRPAQPGFDIQVIGDAVPLTTIAKNAGVHVLPIAQGHFRLEGLSDDDPQPIWEWARQTQTPIARMEPARASLEKIFLDAVRESAHAHP
jgi:ABC-2 type transport system ATP-binding protein